MSDHHEHLRRMAAVASNEDEDALLWALAEIERLQAELEDEEKTVFACMKMCKERDAEIERLRALPRLRKIMEREAEIERLKALLRRWIEWNGEGRHHDLLDESRRQMSL
jgi:hypothetical protein